jgi:hypothetical protein
MLGLVPMLCCQRTDANPRIAGTIKTTVASDLAALFARQMQLIEQRRASWLAKAARVRLISATR